MDFPIYHLDFLGNRMLIAIIATLHVIITHSLAVGGLPLIAWMEKKGLEDPAWDSLAKRLLFTFFLITTTIGAMTGVGIWFSTSLVNPTAIGSLLRVFFWAWFTEWLIFVTEVVLILTYYLTWDRWTGARKKAHVKLGFYLGLASWVTMILIVAILAFMMDPGSWLTQKTLLSGFLNPIYLPQLMFRTPLAMVMAAGAAFFVISFLKKDELRPKVIRFLTSWTLAWLPLLAFGAYVYLNAIPTLMKSNLNVALTTQAYTLWYQSVIYTIIGSVAVILIIMLKGFLTRKLSGVVLMIPFLIYVLLMGQFERSREFIRKPYAIAGYLYANGIRKDEYPLLQRDGLLTYAPYVSVHRVTEENKLVAGKEVFMIACTRCHTINGVNSVLGHLHRMYGDDPLNPELIATYLSAMHQARTFMPPFPGNSDERKALAHYFTSLQKNPVSPEGVQTSGIPEKDDSL